MIVIGLSFNSKVDKGNRTNISERETVEVISSAIGEVRMVNEEVYVIWYADKYLKLNPYNLPKAFKNPGLKISFSGNIKLTNTLEDDWGELFELTKIEAIN